MPPIAQIVAVPAAHSRQGAAPAELLQVRTDIEQLLSAMEVGHTITLGRNWAPLNNPRLSKISRWHVTITLLPNDYYRVDAGKRSKDGTYYFNTQTGEWTLVEKIARLAPGTLVSHGHMGGKAVPVRLPDLPKMDARCRQPERFRCPPELRQLQHGQGVVIYDRDNNPAVGNCFWVKRLLNGDFLVRDGIPAKNMTRWQGPGRSKHEIDGPVDLPGGTVIHLPQGVHFELPEKTRTSALPDVTGHVLERSQVTTGSSVVSRAALDELQRAPEIEIDSLRVALEQALLLRDFIYQGLGLIRDGKHQEAILHFHQPRPEQCAGFEFDINNTIALPRVDRRSIVKTLELIASRSWFRDGRLVSPSDGILPLDFDPHKASADESHLVTEFFREVALIQAEEWLHAYQEALGKHVSKKGILLAGNDWHEHDIALLFRQERVPMSEAFLVRYDRGKGLEALKGVQSEAEAAAVSKSISRMRSAETVVIGRCGDICVSGGEVSRRHLSLTLLEDGNYLLRNGTGQQPSSNGIYYEDGRGVWRKLRDHITLPPGRRVRLSRHYQIALPRRASSA